MTTLDLELARPYIVAGCHVDGVHVVGSEADVVLGLEAIIAGRDRASDEELRTAFGLEKEWLRKKPLDMLKDAGWGSDRNGNLIGGDYEIRRVARTIATLFGG